MFIEWWVVLSRTFQSGAKVTWHYRQQVNWTLLTKYLEYLLPENFRMSSFFTDTLSASLRQACKYCLAELLCLMQGFSVVKHRVSANFAPFCCSWVFVACWTTRFVKGVLPFNPLARTHVSGRDQFQAVRRLDIWKFSLSLCLQNVWFISVKKLTTFFYVVGYFLARIF
jgi:hypothetical protein